MDDLKLIIDANKIDFWNENDRKTTPHLLGANFYPIFSDKLIGFYSIDDVAYPKTNYKLVIDYNGSPLQLSENAKVYEDENGNLFLEDDNN